MSRYAEERRYNAERDEILREIDEKENPPWSLVVLLPLGWVGTLAAAAVTGSTVLWILWVAFFPIPVIPWVTLYGWHVLIGSPRSRHAHARLRILERERDLGLREEERVRTYHELVRDNRRPEGAER